MKVLHVLYQSLPTKVGATIRSRDILLSQKSAGIDVIAVTSPFQYGLTNENLYDEINGIKYYRSFFKTRHNEAVDENQKSVFILFKKLYRIFSFIRIIYKLAKNEKVDVIHAHSTFFCGISSWIVCCLLNKIYVYEVRSLWEEYRKVVSKNFRAKLESNIIHYIESFTIKRAKHVVVISEELRENLLKRGAKDNKISIIGNAVNINLANNTKRIEEKNEYLTLAYIGSVVKIEGLELLIQVMKELMHLKIILKIYGKGPLLLDFEKTIKNQEISNVIIMGEVEQEQLPEVFSQLDVIINPRTKTKITDEVTPLKPLEAMAYKKLVIASDVGGIKEIITDKYNGLLFKADDKESMKLLIQQVYDNGIDHYSNIIANAMDYVKKHRSWDTNALKYKAIYNKLLDKNL
ncbi:MAG: hypothetical protein A2033_15385 [Bacteroidetes bacterium GWA2_31_9]|nr:MAG: hypothetical protein A2033_15385 [Bacteroidetes bacterium GWA2_31_9]